MRSIITQSAVLPAPAENLYAMYMEPERHAEITGAPVTISEEPGSPFRAHGDALSGTMLHVVPGRLVVQSWRSINFKESDPDSTLILQFSPEGHHGRIDLVHLDVPQQDYQGVTEGWEKYYWAPWRRFLTP
jgi:activator of HSP90 ATPase